MTKSRQLARLSLQMQKPSQNMHPRILLDHSAHHLNTCFLEVDVTTCQGQRTCILVHLQNHALQLAEGRSCHFQVTLRSFSGWS